RRDAVRMTTQRAWRAYMKYAAGFDELRPLSRLGTNNVTPIDVLDTFWMMDLKYEFKEAVDIIRNIDFHKATNELSFFETGIRVLGGLLSAYELSSEPILLKKAVEIGDILLVAFNTPTGLPLSRVDPRSMTANGKSVVLAEIGSNQMEFAKLTEFTGDNKYREKSQKVIEYLSRVETDAPGLVPVFMDSISGKLGSNFVTFGALGDSYYEYL
ncbi:glycoside hydrolase, partial [Dimargaris cristalligena]